MYDSHRMRLSDFITGVAFKQIVQVDIPDGGSNQHEFNGTRALCQFFGAPQNVIGSDFRVEGRIDWHYFPENGEVVSGSSRFTFYDARAKSANRTGRSEWRLYYYGDFLNHARAGDALILIRTTSNRVIGLVMQQGSGWLRAARTLFGIHPRNSSMMSIPRTILDAGVIGFAERRILEQLGVDYILPEQAGDREIVSVEFGDEFPATYKMSDLARKLAETDFRDPDTTLLRWIEREEQLFRALESIVVERQIKTGFASVEQFIAYSLSVQNRRKSRMGFSLENHLGALFKAQGIRFEAGRTTEGKNRPDFLFPSQRAYLDPTFPSSALTMLAAKSTCKERWRQILTEAKRIDEKHLLTLDQGISSEQLDEMENQRVKVVIPGPLHVSYPDQRARLLTLADFISLVRRKEKIM